MERVALERRLVQAAYYQAARFGYGFGPDCLNDLKNFVAAGVNVMGVESYLDDEPRIAMAEANIQAFTARMVIEAREMKLPDLTENTFHVAKAALCPLWPFCR